MRQLLNTEVDALLLAPSVAMVIECKYYGYLSREQWERQQRMIKVLQNRLATTVHHVLVTENDRDPRYQRIPMQFVIWRSIEHWLQEHP